MGLDLLLHVVVGGGVDGFQVVPIAEGFRGGSGLGDFLAEFGDAAAFVEALEGVNTENEDADGDEGFGGEFAEGVEEETDNDLEERAEVVDFGAGTLQDEERAGAEEHGEEAAELAVPEGHGGEPDGEVGAGGTAGDGGVGVGGEGEAEVGNVESGHQLSRWSLLYAIDSATCAASPRSSTARTCAA